MKENLKGKLLNNILIKLSAVIIAVFTWLFVVNAQNPLDQTILNVPIEVLNADSVEKENYAYDIESSLTAQVKIEAKRLDISNISASDIRLTIDLNKKVGAEELKKSCNIVLEVTKNKKIIQSAELVSDLWVDITLEPLVTKKLEIVIVSEGNPADDFTTLGKKPVAVPDTVVISGRKTDVDQVASVNVPLNLEGATADINFYISPVLYDVYGNEIVDTSALKIAPEEVQICLPIMETKTLPILIKTKGKPLDGFAVTEIKSNFDTVKVAGYKAVLDELKLLEIPLELMDISGLFESKTFVVDMKTIIPAGTNLMTNDNLTVNVVIESIKEKSFRLSLSSEVEILGRNGALNYHFENDAITINVSGLQEDLNNLTTKNIIASISLDGLGPGTHTVPVLIKVPNEINILNELSVRVTIVKPTLPPTPPPTQPTVQESTKEPETEAPAMTEPETELEDKTVEETKTGAKEDLTKEVETK